MSFSKKSVLQILTVASVVSFNSVAKASSHGDYENAKNYTEKYLADHDPELKVFKKNLLNIEHRIASASNSKNLLIQRIFSLIAKPGSSIKIALLNKEINNFKSDIVSLLSKKAELENLIKSYKPLVLKQYPGMSQTIALWGTQKKFESLKNISFDVEIPRFSKGTESNLMVMLQGTIAGDIFNVGYYYDGKNLDSSGKPARAFVIRRWIDAPAQAAPSSNFENVCSSNENIELFRRRVLRSSDENLKLKQKICYSKESFMNKLVPVNDYVNSNAPSIEIFSELNWEPGKYKISISNIGKDADGDWYSFDVKDSNQISYNMGMLKFSNKNNQLISSVSGSYSLVLSESAPVKSRIKNDSEFKYAIGNLIGSSSSVALDGQAMRAFRSSNGDNFYVRVKNPSHGFSDDLQMQASQSQAQMFDIITKLPRVKGIR